jgi:hypothetical protein
MTGRVLTRSQKGMFVFDQLAPIKAVAMKVKNREKARRIKENHS